MNPTAAWIVGDGIGVRHRADRGESAGRRRARAGRDRLDIFAPRLAQMAVHVDEAGRDDEPGAVDDLEPRRSASTDVASDRLDLAVARAARRFDVRCACDGSRTRPPRSSTRRVTQRLRPCQSSPLPRAPACRRRADRAPPCEPRRRSSPDRGSRCAARRPRRNRSRRRDSSGRGGG